MRSGKGHGHTKTGDRRAAKHPESGGSSQKKENDQTFAKTRSDRLGQRGFQSGETEKAVGRFQSLNWPTELRGVIYLTKR
jgi:hypothetical protein